MRVTPRWAATAALGLALFAGAAAKPAEAATTDYGIVFSGPATLTLSDSTGSSLPFMTSAPGYGISSSGSLSAPQSGSFGGINYGSVFNFNVSQLGGNSTANYNGATLTLNYSSIVGTPQLTLTSNTATFTGPMPVGAAGVFGQQFTLAPSTTPGSIKLDLGSTYAANLQSNVKAGGFNPFGSYLQVAATAVSGGGGSGVPGPVAGAGLPVLAAAAGLAWLRRRRGGSAAGGMSLAA